MWRKECMPSYQQRKPHCEYTRPQDLLPTMGTPILVIPHFYIESPHGYGISVNWYVLAVSIMRVHWNAPSGRMLSCWRKITIHYVANTLVADALRTEETRASFAILLSLHHYSDVIMGTLASQITSLTIAYSTVYSWCVILIFVCTASIHFQTQIKENIKALCHWPLFCAGNPLVTGEFPAQMASNAENVSIWWCYHGSRSNSDAAR